jgi:hypothetical protein
MLRRGARVGDSAGGDACHAVALCCKSMPQTRTQSRSCVLVCAFIWVRCKVHGDTAHSGSGVAASHAGGGMCAYQRRTSPNVTPLIVSGVVADFDVDDNDDDVASATEMVTSPLGSAHGRTRTDQRPVFGSATAVYLFLSRKNRQITACMTELLRPNRTLHVHHVMIDPAPSLHSLDSN